MVLQESIAKSVSLLLTLGSLGTVLIVQRIPRISWLVGVKRTSSTLELTQSTQHCEPRLQQLYRRTGDGQAPADTPDARIGECRTQL